MSVIFSEMATTAAMSNASQVAATAASIERYSAAAASVSASQCSSSSRWIFSGEQLRKVPSIREGMSPEEELKNRRVAANTIHEMADRLNHESRVRMSQLCICTAMMHMHRFFVLHSFLMFDPKDVGAACLFLAGKSEECPRKLDHVTRVWWAIKNPDAPHPNPHQLQDGSTLIVTLENLVLQTIGFDLTVDIPHPYVLTAMQKFSRGCCADASGNRRISEIAYWFASDMLHMTNWGVRYTAKAIACVCIQMACLWAKFEIPTAQDEAPWYKQVDPTMTLDKLLRLTEECSHIYKTYGELLNIKKYAMRSSLRETGTQQNPNQPQQQPQQQLTQQLQAGQNQITPSIATLPPPPVAPQLNAAVGVKVAEPARRIDLSDYKLRNSAVLQQQPSGSRNSVAQTQRRNFMRPDSPPQTISKGLDMPLLPVIASEKSSQSRTDQKPFEVSKVLQMSKSGTPKLTNSQKPIANSLKPFQPIRLSATAGEQERHRRPRLDDYEKESNHRRTEKTSTEGMNLDLKFSTGSHHRKRPYESSVTVGSSDSGSSAAATQLASVTQMAKSGTLKLTERYNQATPTSHMTSRPREEAPLQQPRRDISGGSTSRARDEITASRQREDAVTLKRSRQVAPLNALLPTPPPNVNSVIAGSSQNSKYNPSSTQLSRSTSHASESTHRTSATSWSVTSDYYSGGSSSSNVARFSQPTGSSSHRHHPSSNAGRTKSREPLLSTPDTGSSSYYKRSRPRPLSPIAAATSGACRQSQRQPSPGSRSGSGFPSNGLYCKRRHYLEIFLHYLGS